MDGSGRNAPRRVHAEVPGYKEQILESLTSGVLAVDKDGIVITANAAASAHLHLSGGELEPDKAIGALSDLAPLVELFDEIKQTGDPVARQEIILNPSDGTKKEIGLSASLLQGPADFNGVIFLFTDMTERRQLERAAEINRQLAQVGELTAGVVHDLRNPITVITGMSELLMRVFGDDDPNHRSAELILQEAIHIERLISQFLGYARPLEIVAEPTPPEMLAKRVMQLCAPRAEQKEVSLSWSAQPELPTIDVDTACAAQAIGNIVSNAVDAVQQRGVVSLAIRQEGPDVVFMVSDNGPGVHIGPDDDIFRPFFTKKEGGTGLGLANVHRIITAHSGSVNFSNREEGGACFEVRLPVKKGALG